MSAGLPLLLALLVQGPQPAPAAEVLVAGRDVQAPLRLESSRPAYPEIMRQAAVQGLIILAVTVDEDGKPAEVKALRGIPLLDEAAIKAVRKWRYAPTEVGGVRRRVKFMEYLGFWLSDKDRVQACTGLARDRQTSPGLRTYAMGELLQVPKKYRPEVTETFTALAADPDASIAVAAKAALEKLAAGGR